MDPSANDETFLGLFSVLAVNQTTSWREVGSSLGVSLGSAHYCLRALISKGMVKPENCRKSSNMLALLYLLTPAGIAAKDDLTLRFLIHEVAEYEILRVEIQGLQRECGSVTDAD